MTSPIATFRRSATRRGTLIFVALLYLGIQAALAAHQVEHLVQGEDAPCEICAFGSTAALPPIEPSLAPALARVGLETTEPLPCLEVPQPRGTHLPRAPPV
jgi:hypothetical protein